MIIADFGILDSRQFDVCVAGSGLVGSCLALDLANRGLSVLVLESGLEKPDARIQSLSDAIIASPQYHHPMAEAVTRSLGGTSALWGGRCVLLDEIDFSKRDYVPNSGWPIKYDDISRHERRAAELLGCDDGGFAIDDSSSLGNSEIDFSKLERWVNETRIVHQQPELKSSERIVILLDATVTGISIETGARQINGFRVTREGRSTEFRGACNYVLALGGIETARLLLNVQTEHPSLFGGASGALGRYYMGHISGLLADIRLYDPNQIALFSNLKGRGSFARRRLTFHAQAQLENQIPNIAFWPENASLSDAKHGNGLLSLLFLLLSNKRLGSRFVAEAIRAMQTKRATPYLPHLRNLVTDPGTVVIGAAEVIQQRYWYERRLPRLFMTNRSGNYPLRFHSEQMPNSTNRIRLSEDRDWQGTRRATIEFEFTSPELALIKKSHEILDRSLKRLGLGELIYHGTAEAGRSVPEVAPDGLHQIGSTRMSDRPATGVVDPNCRIFDFENLYVAGSSVFPTSGQASPTFSAVALALRLSEHLARRSATVDGRCQISGRSGHRPHAKELSILFVTASYYPAVRYGGPTYTVHSLARVLAKRGHKVVVYTTNVGADRPPGESDVDGVDVHYFSTCVSRIYWSPAMIRNLRENTSQFDVVHAQGAFMYTTVAARRASGRFGVPFVYSPRGMLVDSLIKKKNYLMKSVWLQSFEVANCEQAAFLHATSEIEAQEIRHLGLRPKLIEVIPNGLDLPEQESEAEDEARRSRILGPRRPYIIILGRVSWKKGIDRLILAMSLVPSINLVIAGNDDENYTPQLLDLAQEYGLADRVIFTGAVYGMDKFALLRGAELFVLPSYSESFGVVVLEALCSGCPVIMTPEVGIAKDIEKLGAGVIIPGMWEELGGAISSLLADSDRRKRMSDIGKRKALEKFSWNSIADDMEAAYRRALHQQRTSSQSR
jgi:glycosyltransferase involved in cell wall biosynthesis